MSYGFHTAPMFRSVKQFIIDMKATFIVSLALSVIAIVVEYLFEI